VNGEGLPYGKEAWLEQMSPYQSDGDMIKVGYGYDSTTY
jgi:hypothetical protein